MLSPGPNEARQNSLPGAWAVRAMANATSSVPAAPPAMRASRRASQDSGAAMSTAGKRLRTTAAMATSTTPDARLKTTLFGE